MFIISQVSTLTPNQRVAKLSRRQHGLVTRSQALAAGVTLAHLRQHVKAAEWERLHAGIYRIAGVPTSPWQLLLAACLAIGPAAMASHRSAAWLWNMTSGELDVVELTVRPTWTGRLPGALIHRVSELGQRKPSLVKAIPVTDPLRTLGELGAVVCLPELAGAVDAAIANRLVTPGRLWAEVRRRSGPGRRGIGRLRRVLVERDPSFRYPPSVLEAKMKQVLQDVRQLGAPEPVRELVVGDRGQYRLDFAYPHARLGIEVDGWASHASFASYQHDRARQNLLAISGWQILRYTWSDVLEHRPQVVAEVAKALELPAGSL